MVTIMLCFARSGGTVLNQCLGCLPEVVILSEVNPLGGGWGVEAEASLTTVKAQAKGWYNIDLDSDEDDFVGCVVELSKKCKHLILRDWTVANFLPNLGKTLEDEEIVFDPPKSFLILEDLQGHCDVKPFAFVRDAFDVYLSKGGNMPIFAESYLCYVKELLRLEVPVCRYEEFCVDPKHVLRTICEYTGIPYTDDWADYAKFTTVHGDIQYNSRGQTQGQIATLPRIKVHESIATAIANCSELQEANRLLEYPMVF